MLVLLIRGDSDGFSMTTFTKITLRIKSGPFDESNGNQLEGIEDTFRTSGVLTSNVTIKELGFFYLCRYSYFFIRPFE